MQERVLCLSFRPLFALRIAFLECEVFFLGTASRIDGNSSSNDSSGDDEDHLNGKPPSSDQDAVAANSVLNNEGVGSRLRVECSATEAMVLVKNQSECDFYFESILQRPCFGLHVLCSTKS